MRTSITAAVFAISAILAGNSAFAGVNESKDIDGYSMPTEAARAITYEVSLSKIKDSAGKPLRAASVQRMTLSTAMHAPASARSLTQTAYPCLDQDGTHLARCGVDDGMTLTLTPRPAGAVSPRILTEVNLHIIDLLNLKDGDTAVGRVQYPTIRTEKLTQEIAITPGEAVQVATGSYVLDIRVKSVE